MVELFWDVLSVVIAALAHCINACTLALVDAHIEMYDLTVAITLHVTDDNDYLVDAAASEMVRYPTTTPERL